MNLHNEVAGFVGSINPRVTATVQPSAGFTQDANFKQVPAYGATFPVQAQLQPLTYRDLQQIDGINVQGQKMAMYLSGDVQAIVRADGRGGDLVTLPDGSAWLTVQLLEDFHRTAGWVKFAVARQQA